ncbi:hypothetical protein BUALT_Bualt13G0070500 [Buddleja alternifolia]|uniref:Shugoshin C-terminal domain-containing protein n=1 Tax=Buddleja alternifolia TaxID=168488 RepID=A0AAV6WMF6_9LAMI|nr:hypothetical protein BUALT_Bualt13G0070500 [Buddleja alternifolia]
MKGDKMAKRSSFGSMVRRRLSDITNSLPQQKSPLFPENLSSDAASAKEFIEHLVKELNMGKERLKALQHELVCKEALLKTKNSQLKVQEKVSVEKTELQEREVVTKETGSDGDPRPCKATRRRRLSRSQSLGSSSLSHQQTEKEAAVASKRRCVRRQSGGTRTKHEEPTEDLFELDDANFPLDESETRRTSVSRPSRKAAEKVQSYKERPLNVKMRRQ